MILFPAIDIKDGKVVRLFKGRFDRVSEYGHDPLAMALHWKSQGASWLHVVDLDGAESGERRNREVILRIVRESGLPVQTGGGIRSREVMDDYLNAGISRVILGTRAVSDRDFLSRAVADWRDRVAVSLDCADGFVARRGWQETSAVRGVDLARELAVLGVTTVIYTDIARDGTLEGPNIEGLKAILDVEGVQVIASGGVKDLEDIRKLSALGRRNLLGVITGKAIYEGKLDLKEALALC